MRLNDFNKLRWTVQALIWQPRLLDHARAHALAEVRVIDSQIAMSSPQAPLPSGCVVVLWDGLNAWLELKNARPELAARTDVTYLYVGGLIDIQAGFPESSAPLFPSQLPDVRRSPDHHLPLRFRATGWMRRSLRPLKNARLDPAAHDRLVKGGCVAFCGIVRPNASMLDGFFFESSLPDLGQAAKSLIGLEWRDRPAAMHAALHPVYEILRRQRPRSASDFAAMYSLDGVALLQQEIGQIGTVLAGDARDQRDLAQALIRHAAPRQPNPKLISFITTCGGMRHHEMLHCTSDETD